MERTFELIRQSQAGDKEAREQLLTIHPGLVWNVVKRFLGRGAETEDLYQIGAIGLMRAIEKFDFSYEVQFSTYAVPLISGEIKRFLRDDGLIRVSRSFKENAWKIQKASEQFRNTYGREATLEELSLELGLAMEEIVLSMEAVAEVASLEQSVPGADGKEIFLKDRLPSERNEAEEIVDHLFIEQLLNSLDKPDRRLIELRYYENKTQMQVAAILGMSQVQVSRKEKRILRQMKTLV